MSHSCRIIWKTSWLIDSVVIVLPSFFLLIFSFFFLLTAISFLGSWGFTCPSCIWVKGGYNPERLHYEHLGVRYLAQGYLGSALRVSWHVPYDQNTSQVLSTLEFEPKTFRFLASSYSIIAPQNSMFPPKKETWSSKNSDLQTSPPTHPHLLC